MKKLILLIIVFAGIICIAEYCNNHGTAEIIKTGERVSVLTPPPLKSGMQVMLSRTKGVSDTGFTKWSVGPLTEEVTSDTVIQNTCFENCEAWPDENPVKEGVVEYRLAVLL